MYCIDPARVVTSFKLMVQQVANSEIVPRRLLVFELVKELSVQQPLDRLWNALPRDTKRAATLLTFKKKLKTFLFSKHLC